MINRIAAQTSESKPSAFGVFFAFLFHRCPTAIKVCIVFGGAAKTGEGI
jgi:hypothetical protein